MVDHARARAHTYQSVQNIVTCPLCNSGAQANKGRKRAQRYYQCSRCEHSYSVPVIRDLMGPLPDGAWSGLEVYIFGGGRTAREFDPRDAHPSPTIACNGAWQIFDSVGLSPTVSWSVDQGWMKLASRDQAYLDAVGLRAATSYDIHIPAGVFVAPVNDVEGHWPSSLRDGLRYHRNSGMSALCLADALGASKIHLIGFDLDGVSGDGLSEPWVVLDHERVVSYATEASELVRATVRAVGGPLASIFKR